MTPPAFDPHLLHIIRITSASAAHGMYDAECLPALRVASTEAEVIGPLYVATRLGFTTEGLSVMACD